MAKTYETEQVQEKFLLAAVDLEDGTDVSYSLDELAELTETAGGIVVGRLIQKRESVHPGTYVGKGKIEELRELIMQTDADGIVCDDELTPAQLMTCESAVEQVSEHYWATYEELQVKVLDRTVMILDIFAAHARTSEGKLQVELAQLRYRSSRLTGLGKSLSRLGGGIGTRGPGEKKLEMDRRLIKERISMLNRQLKEVVKNREVQRHKRTQNPTKTVAIVGYTNAGKSTLLNTLTKAAVLEEDKLFATLDPTTRVLEKEDGQKILFTDTVGFISKLPHSLIRAFRSTLEEAKYADMILHVVDVSNPKYDLQMEVVYDTLRELNIGDKKVITAFNKIDCLEYKPDGLKDKNSEASLTISAKQKIGLDKLVEKIEEVLDEGMVKIEKVFAYDEAGKIQAIREFGRLEQEEYREDGIFVKAVIPPHLL